MVKKPNITPVDFERFVATVQFDPKSHTVTVSRTHCLAETKLEQDIVTLDLRRMDFKTAMEITCALVSSVGLVDYGI